VRFRFFYWFLYPWALPATLIGLLLAIPYRAHSWRWNDGCLEAISSHILGKPDAQTHGWLIFYASDYAREHRILRAHERVHVVQGLFGGPFFMFAYGLCFLFYLGKLAISFQGWWQSGQSAPWWYDAYMMIPFERQAYRMQHNEGAWGAS